MEITPAIAYCRNYGIANPLCGLKRTFVFYSSYYWAGTYWMTYCSVCQRKYFEDWIFPQITKKIFHYGEIHSFLKWRKQTYSNEIWSSDTQFITGSFLSDRAISDSRYYGHQMTPRVSAITKLGGYRWVGLFVFTKVLKQSLWDSKNVIFAAFATPNVWFTSVSRATKCIRGNFFIVREATGDDCRRIPLCYLCGQLRVTQVRFYCELKITPFIDVKKMREHVSL